MAYETHTSPVIEESTKTQVRHAPRWRIIGLNDDVTTMEFVILLLMDVYHKTQEAAFELMMEVHEKGSGVFYVGSKEACELKVEQTEEMNKAYEQHLQIRMEPIEE